MIILAVTRNRIAIIVLSPTAGIMYATLFTMPYLLVANYHTNGQVYTINILYYFIGFTNTLLLIFFF